MAYTKRVVINRSKVSEVRLALADGLFEVGKQVIAAAHPPDPTPFGVGLVEGGGVIAFVDGKKVNGTTIGGRQIKKPRAVRTPRPGILVVAGYGFPGRFVHNGSIHNRPKPFLAHARDQVVPVAGQIMAATVRPRLASIR